MIKKLPKSKIEFELTVTWTDWKKYLNQAVEEVSREIKISGFRPGKAPRNIVEQKVGKGVILNKAAEKSVKKAYAQYVAAEKLKVIGQPKIVIEKLEEDKDFVFKAQVAVMPEVKLYEKYKKAIKKINAEQKEKKAEISDDEIELEMEKLANSRVKLVTVRRAAKNNDNVEIDFTVLVGNVPIENGTSKKHQLIIGRGVFIPGFEENIIGMQEGEKKEFELNFPADYHKKDLNGKLATFKVKMNLVQERQVPELNDEFAKSLGNFENLEALKKNIREGILEERRMKIKEQKRIDFIEKIIENSEIELPEILTRGEIRQMMHEFEQNLAPMGMNLDQYLEKLKKDRKEMEKDWESMAEKRVKSAFLLGEIAKLEEITVNSAEIEAEMNKTMQYYKNVKNLEKNIDMEKLYNHVRGMLENEKVFEFLEKL
jgi:trigger factor